MFALAKRRSGQLSSMLWGARGTVVHWANRPVGVRSCLVPPRPAAPLRAAPNRSARSMFGFWIRKFMQYMSGNNRYIRYFSNPGYRANLDRRHHGTDGDLRSNLRLRRSKMGSSIFGVGERRGGSFYDSEYRGTPHLQFFRREERKTPSHLPPSRPEE